MSGVVGGLGLSVVLITYFLVAHTPLTEYVVPGYVANQYREDASIARAQAASALAALESHGRYIENLKITTCFMKIHDFHCVVNLEVLLT